MGSAVSLKHVTHACMFIWEECPYKEIGYDPEGLTSKASPRSLAKYRLKTGRQTPRRPHLEGLVSKSREIQKNAHIRRLATTPKASPRRPRGEHVTHACMFMSPVPLCS